MRLATAALVCVLVIVANAGASSAAPSNDDSIAAAGVLTLQDFPAGWSTRPQSGSSSVPAKVVASVRGCKQFASLLASTKSAVQVYSPSSFTDGSVTVANNVTVYRDDNRAVTAFASAKGPAFRTCVRRLVEKAFHDQLARSKSRSTTQVTVNTDAADPGSGVGDDRAAFTETVTVTQGGVGRTQHFENLLVRVGRTVDSFSYQRQTAPIDDTMPGIVGASVGRLTSALRG